MSFIDKLLIVFIFVVNISTAAASCAIGLMTAMVLYRGFKYKEWPHIDKQIGYLFLTYFALQIIIAALSINPQISFREVLGEVHRCFPLFFAMAYIKSQRQLRDILIAFMLSVLVNNIYAEIQCFVIHVDRAYAFAHTPTFYASFLLMQIPVLIFITTLDFMPKWSRKLSVLVTIMSIQMLIATITRGAWLAFLATGIAFIILDERWRKKSIKYFAGALIVSIAIIISAPNLQDRAATLWNPNYTSNSERLLMWQSSLAIIEDYPIHGIGQKMFQLMYNTKYISPLAKERSDNYEEGHTHPHNNFFKVATEGGFIGLFAFVILHGYFFKRLYLLQKKERHQMTLSCGIVGFLILLALQLEGLTDTNMNQVPIMREYWFLIGMLMVSGKFVKNL